MRKPLPPLLASSGHKRISSYRGSFLMWARENVEFTYANGHVTWSSGYQESGAVFPNNVENNGTSLAYASSAEHRWRGSYTVGAGVPTPWGKANVYSATSTISTTVRGNGSWTSQWTDR